MPRQRRTGGHRSTTAARLLRYARHPLPAPARRIPRCTCTHGLFFGGHGWCPSQIKLALPHIRRVRVRTLGLLREYPNNAILSLIFRVAERVLALPLDSSLLKVRPLRICGGSVWSDERK